MSESELSIELSWTRQEPELLPNKYSSEHSIKYNQGYTLKGDAAPSWGGNALNTNPEQALAAALSSCHMMTFLALAAKVKWPVASFKDKADAHLGKDPQGKMCISQIDLNPFVEFDDGFEVDKAKLDDMHERAHRYCFVANSLADHVVVYIK